MTAESFACHDCPRRHAAPSSSGHGRSPGDHPCWLGLRPGRRLRQRATEGRPRQRRRATCTPPRHGTAATCALASFLVVVVQRGGRRFGSCSYRQGGPVLGRQVTKRRYSPFCFHFHPALVSLAFREPVRVTSAPRVVVGMMLRAPVAPPQVVLREVQDDLVVDRSPTAPGSIASSSLMVLTPHLRDCGSWTRSPRRSRRLRRGGLPRYGPSSPRWPA